MKFLDTSISFLSIIYTKTCMRSFLSAILDIEFKFKHIKKWNRYELCDINSKLHLNTFLKKKKKEKKIKIYNIYHHHNHHHHQVMLTAQISLTHSLAIHPYQ